MAIHYISPPESSRQIARTGLQHLAALAQDARATDLMALRANDMELAVPHTVHHAGLDSLAARRPLTDATVTGWRYLARRNTRALASTEVSADADGLPAGLEQVNMGPFVAATAQALDDLVRNVEIQAGDYELRMLKVPGLCAVMLWLYAQDGSLFVPLAPAPGYLEAGRVYHEDEMLDALEGPARLRLEFDDSRDEPYGDEAPR